MQSRLWSLIETLVNIIIGLVVSFASQLVIFHFYGVSLDLTDNMAITGWFTLVSILRSYVLRRVFNRIRR